MGYYINEDSKGNLLPSSGKAKKLIEDGAKVVDGKTFQENLVCVVENERFDAAGFAHSQAEMDVFNAPCGRTKTWLVYEHAKRLSGYDK